MYCTPCGSEINDKAVVCPNCGSIVDQQAYNTAFNAAPTTTNNGNNVKEDVPNPGFSVLAFLIPLFGIVYFFAERKNTPKACKRYLIWSIVGIAIMIVFFIAYIAFLVILTINDPDFAPDYYHYY